MSGYRDWAPSSEEHRPLTYWGGHPIYATHMVIIVYCALMLVTVVLGSAMTPVFNWLGFSSIEVLRGQVWRFLTYGLFNPISLGFAIDMLMLFWFGRELERTFGRKIFGYLYGGIYLIPPIVLTLMGLFTPTTRIGQPGAFALFIAFATYFPNMPVFFVLTARWAALILVAVFSLMAVAARDWWGLLLLASNCGFAHLFVRYQQGIFTLPSFKLLRRKPKLRVLPDLPQRSSPARVAAKSSPAADPAPDATMAEVDALLDKIAKSGINSLTTRERAKLEAARADLLRRGSK